MTSCRSRSLRRVTCCSWRTLPRRLHQRRYRKIADCLAHLCGGLLNGLFQFPRQTEIESCITLRAGHDVPPKVLERTPLRHTSVWQNDVHVQASPIIGRKSRRRKSWKQEHLLATSCTLMAGRQVLSERVAHETLRRSGRPKNLVSDLASRRDTTKLLGYTRSRDHVAKTAPGCPLLCREV